MPSAPTSSIFSGHPDEVGVAGLQSLLGGRTRLGDLAPGEQVGRVRERPVRLVVQTEVGHEAVEHRDDRGVQHGLDMVLLQHHDRLGRLHRVVGVADLHGVEAEGALEGAERLLSGERQTDAGRELRGVERVGGAVLAEHRLVAALHAPDAAGAGEHLEEVVELVGLEDGDLAPPRRRRRTRRRGPRGPPRASATRCSRRPCASGSLPTSPPVRRLADRGGLEPPDSDLARSPGVSSDQHYASGGLRLRHAYRRMGWVDASVRGSVIAQGARLRVESARRTGSRARMRIRAIVSLGALPAAAALMRART